MMSLIWKYAAIGLGAYLMVEHSILSGLLVIGVAAVIAGIMEVKG